MRVKATIGAIGILFDPYLIKCFLGAVAIVGFIYAVAVLPSSRCPFEVGDNVELWPKTGEVSAILGKYPETSSCRVGITFDDGTTLVIPAWQLELEK